jgi:hypothetical protein
MLPVVKLLIQQQIKLHDRLDEHLWPGGTFGNFIIEEGATVPMPRTVLQWS